MKKLLLIISILLSTFNYKSEKALYLKKANINYQIPCNKPNVYISAIINLIIGLKPKKLKVSKVRTEISENELKLILKESHADIFGFHPSQARLHMAWAQIAFENGRGKKVFNHNLGNIGGHPIKPIKHYYVISGHRFRSFENFNDGAKSYWKHLKNRCSAALNSFDSGDPHMVSHHLQRCGYYRANINHYSQNLASLYFESIKKL